MIARIRGELIEINAGRVVIDCAGVGYEVLIPVSSAPALPLIGERADLFTRQIFREDTQFLVGFLDDSDRRLFDLLTDVKGCGPKISLQIISDLGTETTLAAIATEDIKTLSRATGVGARMAERIVVELREKVRQETFSRKINTAVVQARLNHLDDELIEALLALGYRRSEAEHAASTVADTTGTTQDKLRLALKALTR